MVIIIINSLCLFSLIVTFNNNKYDLHVCQLLYNNLLIVSYYKRKPHSINVL